MQFKKLVFVPMLALALFLTTGCASQPPRKTASQEGIARWNVTRAGVLYSLAREQFEGGNLEDCRKTLTNASKMAPDHVQIRLLSAKLSIEQGQLEAAELELNRVRELDPKNGEADYLTGVIYQRWQKPELAYQSYIKAAGKNPNELAYVMAQAEMLVQLEQSSKALEMLKEKLGFFENSPAIRDAVGQLLVGEGQYQEAIPLLRSASTLAPDESTIREHYGMALYYNKQYREAAGVLERLLKEERFRSRADILTAMGECQLELDQPREARDNFELASQLSPDMVSTWLNLAKAALRLNDLKRADLSLRKAMTIEPRSADANLLMGYLRLQNSEVKTQNSESRKKLLEEALSSFHKASTLSAVTMTDGSVRPTDSVALCMSGLVLEKMGRSDEAIRYYSQALKIKPNDELATSLLAKAQVEPDKGSQTR